MLHKAVTDVLAQQQVQGEITLAPFGVRMLVENNATDMVTSDTPGE